MKHEEAEPVLELTENALRHHLDLSKPFHEVMTQATLKLG